MLNSGDLLPGKITLAMVGWNCIPKMQKRNQKCHSIQVLQNRMLEWTNENYINTNNQTHANDRITKLDDNDTKSCFDRDGDR